MTQGGAGVYQEAVHPPHRRRYEQQEVLHQRAGDEDQAAQAVRQGHVPQGGEENPPRSTHHQIFAIKILVVYLEKSTKGDEVTV
jgi:hypothetical protein